MTEAGKEGREDHTVSVISSNIINIPLPTKNKQTKKTTRKLPAMITCYPKTLLKLNCE